MIQFTLQLTGVEEMQADIDGRLEALLAGVEEDLDWFGRSARDEMVATHTFQNRTFRLERSIGYTLVPWVNGIAQVTSYAIAPYASQVEFGHPGPPPARPYPFFWPVFYHFEAALWDRVRETMLSTIGDVR